MGSHDFLWYLAVLSVRSLGVACLTWAALWVIRVKSAAVKHAAWTVVTAVMLLQFLASPALPPIFLRVLAPAPDAVASVAAERGLPPVPLPVGTSPGGTLAITWREVVVAVYATVTFALLVRLALGYMFSRRLVGNSKRIDGGRLRESESISVPMTVGQITPTILLPIGWREWDAPKLQAVLAHEEAHVRRADCAIGAMARINCYVFWFHPLAWWLKRELARLAEYACDDSVLAQIADRRQYAQALLEIACTMKAARGRLVEGSVAMAKETNVGKRIEQILDDRRTIPPAFGRRGWGAMLLCVLPVGYFASVVQLARTQTKTATPVTVQSADHQPIETNSKQIAQRNPAAPGPASAPLGSSRTTSPSAEVTYIISDAEREAYKQLKTTDDRQKFLEQIVAQAKPPEVPAVAPATRPLRTALDSPYIKWLDEEVAYIISDQERQAFQRLRTDDERQMFITQFWLRRDPTPGTSANEMKEENYRRIAYANDRFTDGIPGWQTDRGMVYIKYGPPDAIDSHGATPSTYPYEIWRYADPGGFGPTEFEFVDPTMTGRYHLTKDPSEKNTRR